MATLDHAPTLIIRQPESPVMAVVDLGNGGRAAQYVAKLILPQLGVLGAAIGKRLVRNGIESIVAIEFEDGPMQLIRAALADDVDLVGAETVLRRVGRALHLEFLNRILRQNHGRRAQRRIGIRQAVEGVVVRLRTAAIDADRIAFALPHLTLFAQGLHRTRAYKKKIGEIAAIQRQIRHLLLTHNLRYRGGVRIQRNTARVHLDGLRNGARLQLQVDAFILRNFKHDAGDNGLGKSRHLHRHPIGAGNQVGNRVVAGSG